MITPDLPERRSTTGNWLQEGSNVLDLDEAKLTAASRRIRELGFSREQLNAIYFGDQNEHNPLLIVWIDDVAQQHAERKGLDGRSFRRGAALALFLISESSPIDEGHSVQGIPFMGMGARAQAGTYLKQHPDSNVLLSACVNLLGSQTELNKCFEEALSGMPEGTDGEAARFGGSVALLGVMSSSQFGGANIELYPSE